MLERGLLPGESDHIEPRDLRFDSGRLADSGQGDSARTLQDVERRQVERVLGEERGHVERAARRLEFRGARCTRS